MENSSIYNVKLTETYQLLKIRRIRKFGILVLLILMLLVKLSSCLSCSLSTPSSTTIETKQFSFTGYTQSNGYGVTTGLVSKSIYYMYRISTPSTYCVIRKITPSDTEAWKSAYQYYPIVKSMAVDPTEQNVYTAIWNNPTSVVRIRASDGTFVDSQS